MVSDPDLANYDIILINSSAGKDSQATLTHLVNLADSQHVDRSNLIVVHADLGRVEWPGTKELAARQAAIYGLRFEVVSRAEDLLDQITTRHHRLRAKGDTTTPAWPSSKARYCTSDQKTSQVTKLITRLVTEKRNQGITRPVRILNCLGIRAAESPARAKKAPFGPDSATWSTPPRVATASREGREGIRHSKRTVDRWFPIFDWSDDDVWRFIRESGVPHHPAYDAGMSRLSCVFCVFSTKRELMLAARLNQDLGRQYADVERLVGHTFRQNLSIAEIVDQANREVSTDELTDSSDEHRFACC
jgi:3'-phosphoadenosine 5'-phosphosulfate sulfotransferase (PAPS reductase)/FAD synthetase